MVYKDRPKMTFDQEGCCYFILIQLVSLLKLIFFNPQNLLFQSEIFVDFMKSYIYSLYLLTISDIILKHEYHIN